MMHPKQAEAQIIAQQAIIFKLCHITLSTKGHSKSEKRSAIIQKIVLHLKWSHLPQSAYLWCLCTERFCSVVSVSMWSITILCKSLYHAPVTCCGELCAQTCPLSLVKCATATVRTLSQLWLSPLQIFIERFKWSFCLMFRCFIWANFDDLCQDWMLSFLGCWCYLYGKNTISVQSKWLLEGLDGNKWKTSDLSMYFKSKDEIETSAW